MIVNDIQDRLTTYFDRGRDARTWYNDVHTFCQRTARYYAPIGSRDYVGARAVAGIVAAYSPRTPWPRNLALVITTLRTGTARGSTGSNNRKVDAILRGECPYAVLKGRKVKAFFSNILNPDHDESVTIDSWMVLAVEGSRQKISARTLDKAFTVTYDYYSGIIRDFAKSVNVRPHEAQAAIWTGIKRTYSRAENLDLFYEGGGD